MFIIESSVLIFLFPSREKKRGQNVFALLDWSGCWSLVQGVHQQLLRADPLGSIVTKLGSLVAPKELDGS